MYLDRDDFRGLVLFLALLFALSGVTLFFRTRDLPPGSYLGRGRYAEAVVKGRPWLKPYAVGCVAAAVCLGWVYSKNEWWTK
jgi:hypothetical protein